MSYGVNPTRIELDLCPKCRRELGLVRSVPQRIEKFAEMDINKEK